MNAADLLSECDRLGVRLCRKGDRLIYSAPANVLTNDLLAVLKAHKPDLLAVLTDAETITRTVLHFTLPDHPANAWATYIGRPGDSRDTVLASLLNRWPDAEVRDGT